MTVTRSDAAVITSTAVAGAAAAPVAHVMGVIFMGAFGGTLYAVLKAPKCGLLDSLRLGGPRLAFSVCLSWLASVGLQGWLSGHGVDAPEYPVFLATAFVLAAPMEAWRQIEPILGIVGRIFRPKDGNGK